jgi:AcrR family transcriptional regulator
MNAVNSNVKKAESEPGDAGATSRDAGASQRAAGRNPRGEGDRLRAQLLEAATELIAEKEDPDEVSVRAVTARAGVSPTALYLHFEGREGLFLAVSEECFAELGDTMREARAAAGPDPREQLLALGRAYLSFASERAGHYAVLFQRHLNDLDPEDEVQRKVGMDVFEILVDVIRANGVAEDASFDQAFLIWMSMHGRVAVAAAMPGFPFPEDEHFLESLVERALGD